MYFALVDLIIFKRANPLFPPPRGEYSTFLERWVFLFSWEVNIQLFLRGEYSAFLERWIFSFSWKVNIQLFLRGEYSDFLERWIFHFSWEVNIPLFTDNINLPQSGFTRLKAQIPEESGREKNFTLFDFVSTSKFSEKKNPSRWTGSQMSIVRIQK